MHGAFTTHNFTVSGTVSIGVGSIGKNLLLTDISGARLALDMDRNAEQAGADALLLFSPP